MNTGKERRGCLPSRYATGSPLGLSINEMSAQSFRCHHQTPLAVSPDANPTLLEAQHILERGNYTHRENTAILAVNKNMEVDVPNVLVYDTSISK